MPLIPIILFCFSTTITPGPNNIMIMSSGVNFGLWRSLPHFLGICIGFPVMVLLVGLGFGALFIHYPNLHEIIKVLGAFYLLYLAWQISRSHSNLNSKNAGKPLTFWQAAFFQWLNPKAWVMAMGAVSAYTSTQHSIMLQVLVITIIFLLMCFSCVGTWLCFGKSMSYALKNERSKIYFNYFIAGLLVISVVLVFFE